MGTRREPQAATLACGTDEDYPHEPGYASSIASRPVYHVLRFLLSHAARAGRPQRWVPARRQLAIALAGSANLRCAGQTTLEWLESVVGLHDEDRTRGFEAQARQGFYSQVERLEPDHGTAGQEVRVEGTNLQCAIGVRIEQGTQSELADLIPDPGGGGASFTVPEGLAPGAAEVSSWATSTTG